MGTRFFTTVIVMLALLISGCQTMSPYPGSGFVATEDRLSISQAGQPAVWNGKDLTVEYRYSRNHSQMDITGRVDFEEHMTNSFTTLHDFRLSVVFADESGKVLGSQGLATDRGYFYPIPFHTKLTVPTGAAFMAFSYQGTAIEGGNSEGGGSSYFWHYPVR